MEAALDGAPPLLRPLQHKEWKQLDPKGDLPSLRQGHAVAVVKDKAYLFGGSAVAVETDSIYYNDLYTLSLTTADSFWEKVEQKGDLPLPGEGHSMITINDAIFLCGGTTTDSAETCVSELHMFDTESCTWTMKQPIGAIPQATSSTMVTTDDGRVVMFGGVYKGKALNDTCILNIDTLEWTLAETKGTPPHPRCDHGCCVVDQKMFVFGGSGGESLWLNDLSYLDLGTLEWVSLGVLDNSPTPRDYTTMKNISSKFFKQLVLFGGFGTGPEEEVCSCDTFLLSLKNEDIFWKQITFDDSTTLLPPGRYGHASFTLGNQLFIHGGQDTDKMFNDLWVLEFELPKINISPTVAPRRNYKTDTPVPLPRKPLAPPTPKEIEPRDFETLRSQYVGQINEIFDTLSKQFEELDSKCKMLEAEREQFEKEREELHETYDKQEKEVTEVLENHKRDNEEWVMKMRNENDEERRLIAEEKAQLKKDCEEFEQEKQLFQEKSIKLDNIMKQVKGLTS